MMPPAYGGAEGRIRLLLTKNPTRSFSFPWCQVHSISFEPFPRPWQPVGAESGPSYCADSNLACFKEVPTTSLKKAFQATPWLVHLHNNVWWTVASQKRNSTIRARRKLPCPSRTVYSLWACQAWVLYPHNSKDHWNDQALFVWPSRENIRTTLCTRLLLTKTPPASSVAIGARFPKDHWNAQVHHHDDNMGQGSYKPWPDNYEHSKKYQPDRSNHPQVILHYICT